MIKFNTQLGFKHLNAQAKMRKEMLLPFLKGMSCTKCPGVTTIISFEETGYTGALASVEGRYLSHKINACCDEFKKKD